MRKFFDKIICYFRALTRLSTNPFSWFIYVFIYFSFFQRLPELLTGKLLFSEFVSTLVTDFSKFLSGPWGQMAFFVGAVTFLYRAATLLINSEARGKQAVLESQKEIYAYMRTSVEEIKEASTAANEKIIASVLEVVKPADRIEGLKVLRGSLEELKVPLGIMQSGISKLESFKDVILKPGYNDHEVQINHTFSEIFNEFNRGFREVQASHNSNSPHPNLGIIVVGRVDDDGAHDFYLSDNTNLSSQIDAALQVMKTAKTTVQDKESQIRSNIIAIASELAQDLRAIN